MSVDTAVVVDVFLCSVVLILSISVTLGIGEGVIGNDDDGDDDDKYGGVITDEGT